MLYFFLKRAIDITGAMLGLILFAPLFLIIAPAIKLESRGPVFVGLKRVSMGRVVDIYKFRTMVERAHELKPLLKHLNERSDGPFFKIKNDPRLTRVGKILRKFRFDEFPQLLNVLEGKLSLVGPRPHETGEIEHYPEKYKHIVLAKSGVTGMSQVNGASGLPFITELELDSRYITEQSLLLDLKILGKTVAIFFFDPTGV